LLVTGLENSGTSAVAASLRMLGVHMGYDAVLDSIHEDNIIIKLASSCGRMPFTLPWDHTPLPEG